MKRVLLSAVLTLCASASAAFANPTFAKAYIPYQFNANGVNLPAGHYDIQISGSSVVLRSPQGGVHLSLPTYRIRPTEAKSTMGLVMKRDGEKMRLVGVREPNAQVVRVMSPGY